MARDTITDKKLILAELHHKTFRILIEPKDTKFDLTYLRFTYNGENACDVDSCRCHKAIFLYKNHPDFKRILSLANIKHL